MNGLQLESARLILRLHTEADLDECQAMWSDPAVLRYIGGTPLSREDTWNKMLRFAGLWSLVGYGYLAVRHKDGRYVGNVGLAKFYREVPQAPSQCPEIGWALASWAHGQGYATEAASRLLRWADTELPLPKTWCLIDAEHAKSFSVAQKCGYVRTVESRYHDKPVILFERVTQLT
jgi:RimJ/RimL family protein N-acetyltransferase